MDNRIVMIDFSGTLIKPFVAEQANIRRLKLLEMPLPDEKQHKLQHGTKEHYKIIKDHITKKMGVTDDMKIPYLQNYGGEILVSGTDMKTMIMTGLFRDCIYMVAAEHRENVFVDGMLQVLEAIRKKGYKLAICSGIRKDIITGILAITKCPLKFDYIYAQDPVLSRDDNMHLAEKLSKNGTIEYVIGDKKDDLLPAKKFNAVAVFVKWGHPVGGEMACADYAIDNPKELLKIIK
ncbi:HAD family hydrolase [Candidatus Woesearchaeota archaeon]|nr:HAD family hydrolase [Candidatus Woesearchaeota archaeon]